MTQSPGTGQRCILPHIYYPTDHTAQNDSCTKYQKQNHCVWRLNNRISYTNELFLTWLADLILDLREGKFSLFFVIVLATVAARGSERGIQIRNSRIGPPEFSVMNQSINRLALFQLFPTHLCREFWVAPLLE